MDIHAKSTQHDSFLKQVKTSEMGNDEFEELH